tara:strand:+ start:2404 stop:3201 length:798 start_codon:yes stop_codon:yes gene_type:complete
MKYYLYHIPGKKIGVTTNLKRRVEDQQGYKPSEYEVLIESDDIEFISDRELWLQMVHGYPVDETPYKNLNCNKKPMNINVTEQTTTFPVPLNKLKGRLMDSIGMEIKTPYANHKLSTELVDWIQKNATTSQFNEDRCYVYNKSMFNYCVKCNIDGCCDTNIDKQISRSNVFDNIRSWAMVRGIYEHGNTQTQFTKLVEEVGELAQAILKKDKVETIDAIGDITIVLTNLAKLEKLDIEDCIDNAYKTISKRTGKMVDGTFVKNTL